ncbi:MAG: AAA family ATPase [Firmicutes bacterium]|nr:AAA family ATPase [Bacillota bacterium]
MQVRHLHIQNFRGISEGEILLPKHAVLIGDNNIGKTTILEAIDLVLGPDRLNRVPPVDEHDFYQGKYTCDKMGILPKITIEVTITDLSEEQMRRFGDYIEWWDIQKNSLYNDPDPAGLDTESITSALRITFIGNYDAEEDDFKGKTYYTRSLIEDDTPQTFSKTDKQYCGFLYLRSLRTGSRALSLERGSLLDIILRLKEIRPKMWEAVLDKLSSFTVASDPDFNVSGVLQSINVSLKKYVPKEWGVEPHLKVSKLTREHLREVITAFITTDNGEYAVPFYRQGTGTINMLVLAMLSQIAEDKQNVIFAMEEPEIAIPPYTQKRIVDGIRNLSSQSIFTSHSPYVIEEFTPEETIVLSRDSNGRLKQTPIVLPDSVKLKRYRQEFRTRFCEGLLARRVLIAEGATEATSLPAVARRLAELNPKTYVSFETLGICTIDAGSEDKIADLAELYRHLGKKTFAVCDKQSDENRALIENQVDKLFMHEEKGFEDLVLKNTTKDALIRFADLIDWPPHILTKYPNPKDKLVEALKEYFIWTKGRWGIADFLVQCSETEIPDWIRKMCTTLKAICESSPAQEYQGNIIGNHDEEVSDSD